MRRQPPIVRCFSGLCIIAAASLLALEWRNPFPDPIVTPDDLSAVVGEPQKKPRLQKADKVRAAEEANAETASGSWARETKTKMPVQSPVRLTLSLADRSLEVRLPGGEPVRYDVAIGQDDWQTPMGSFEVMSKLENPAWQHPITKEEIPPGPDNPLGDRWIGFWTDGEAQIGFHGTNQENLIGEAVSHGCVRMRNQDIKALYEKVAIGTRVEVVAQTQKSDR
ncbi:MAG: L,D-transpeptidase [Cyanobacteria bacterium J06634_6]